MKDCTDSYKTDLSEIYQPNPKRTYLRKDLVGEVIGDFTVISYSGTVKKGKWYSTFWNIKCNNCGAEDIRRGKNLKARKTRATCKKCGVAKKMSSNGKKVRGGTDNITGAYWNSLVYGAKNRKKDFNLTIEDAQKLLEEQDFKCALTGVKLIMDINLTYHLVGPGEKNTGSLDRIDSSKGYTKENVQWVHKDINAMKMNLEESKFKEWCRLVTENN